MAINVTWLQNGGYTAPQDRTEQTAMLTKNAVVSVRPGIILSDGTDATVSAQGTPNMTVNISPFQAIVPDANGRAYVFTSDSAVVSPTFATASGSNPRIDLVIARVYDNAAGDSAATGSLTLPGTAGSITVQTVTGAIELVTGTPNASPTAPPLPNTRCIILAVVTVGTSVTSIATGAIGTSGGGVSRAGYTVAAGGILPCTSSATYPTSPYVGMRVDDLALGGTVRWNGAAWAPIDTDSGWQNLTLTSPWAAGAVTPQYRKQGGRVWLRGNASGGATGSAIFTMPAGYRPAFLVALPAIVTISPYAAALTMATTGVTNAFFSSSGTISIDGLSFPID